MNHEYSAVTVFSNGFQYLHCLKQKGKITRVLLLNEEVNTNLTESPSLHNQKQKVTKSQHKKKTVDVLMKLLNAAEASLDPVLVSAAGVCPHVKDENMGTTRLCHKVRLPLQPVPRH